ncbi:cellulose synthase-like protein G2 [Andrographis paniculata]|uniref:cellulose synthase-like protein G2 n=1 Tax=Andrographis paniculata TaxID=175694 RepID=UPI0021E7CF41|nr:cellulose synthase-like protein G2 [Andrographis paniculata]
MAANSLPLNDRHVRNLRLLTNRLHFFIHGAALLFLFHYRLISLAGIFQFLTLIAEAILAFLWLLNQPSKWTPVVRTAFPDRLPGDRRLPAVDVFVCTADPGKEPSLEVMNTVVSAMALDYPPEKLHVYISDDGGSSVTLRTAREAWEFARCWVPFCRKYAVENRCPEAYFMEEHEECHGRRGKAEGTDFAREEKEVQIRYEEFRSRVLEIVGETSLPPGPSKDHSPLIEIISNNKMKDEEIPFLAYVRREKRPNHHHRFKAGALNVLLRVSAMLTNSPYILVLDCDMYCADSSSARQAMCFHLDPELSPKLAFVQFPQRFYNINPSNDIYDCQLRYVWEKSEGFDGILGPLLSGTGFYIKREALYGTHKSRVDEADLVDLKKCFGSSNEFIQTMYRSYGPISHPNNVSILDDSSHKELQTLASCSYDNGTKWGEKVGFRYFSVIEDYFTGFNLHCEGWTSVYLSPKKPCFLGAMPISLGGHLIQFTRWNVGLCQIGSSKYSPLLYGPFRMSLWESISYAEFAHTMLYFVPFYVLAIVPQLCLLRGIPLYPEVSSPYFLLFLFIFLSSQLKHAQEVLSTGHSLRAWVSEQRIWAIHAFVPYLYAAIEWVMEKIGVKSVKFLPTNKVTDDEEAKLYRSGMFDFRAPAMFVVPLCSLYMVNVGSFLVGLGRIVKGNRTMVMQELIPMFGMVLHFPIFEGMFLRKDKGRVSPFVCFTSFLLSGAFLSFALFVV